MARLLRGAWRGDPPPPSVTPRELQEVLPLLHAGGSSGLAWWRIRGDRALATSPAGQELRNAFRVAGVRAVGWEGEIAEVLERLRSADVDPLLVKGWDATFLYPDPALRPYVDIDLVVRPEQLDAARAAVPRLVAEERVDIINHWPEIRWQGLDRLFAGSRIRRLGHVPVRVPSEGDTLRIVAVHAIRHGAWRPRWLCDVAAAVEAAGPGFDWEAALGTASVQADWVTAAIALARDLLGARLDGVPLAVARRTAPRWLVRTVLGHWSRPWPGERTMEPFPGFRRPRAAVEALRKHWPDPLQARVNLGAALGTRPHLPYQVADAARRTLEYMRRRPTDGLGVRARC